VVLAGTFDCVIARFANGHFAQDDIGKEMTWHDDSMNDERTADEQEIVQLFEDGDRALLSGDGGELGRIYADDYIQYDELGQPRTKENLIRTLTSGELRFVSMQSTGRRIRLFGDFAIVHGSEEDGVERASRRETVRYRYMDVVVRRDGRWQIVASQLTRVG
jgi:ketosteroid isomerase-like protein